MVTTRSRQTNNTSNTTTASQDNHKPASKKQQKPPKRPNDAPEPPGKPAQRQKTSQDQTTSKPAPSPSSPQILERGTLYYFIRPRVNIETPKSIGDIARGYILLRPASAAAGDSSLTDAAASATSRLLALPKKMLPGSSRDRFMAYVEKSDESYDELRDDLLRDEDYETKTAGPRHRPAATPVAEGVYVLSSTGRESHLSYMVTVPSELGDLQRALRLREKGSFIVSSKNPDFEGPANAQLPEKPDYSKDIMQKFNNLRWAPTDPDLLNHANAQILLIGDSTQLANDLESGKTEADDDEDPVSVLHDLQDEDVSRMKHLSENEADAIYEDLRSRAFSQGEIRKDL